MDPSVSELERERSWHVEQLDRMRSELPRVNTQAQVVSAGVLAVMAGVVAARPAASIWLALSAVCGVAVLVAAGASLWPVLKGFGSVTYPAGNLNELARARALTMALLRELEKVERIVRRKFVLVRLAYGSALAGLLFLLVALI